MHIACEQVIWPSTLPQLVLMLCPSVVQEMHLSLLFPRKEVRPLLRKPHKSVRNIWAFFSFTDTLRRRALTSDWSANSFIMVVSEISSKSPIRIFCPRQN